MLNSVVGQLGSGGSIYALEGTYNVTTPIFFNTGVTLRCASWLTNFAEQSGMTAGSAIFQIGSLSNGTAITDTEISDCKITGRQSDLTERIFGIKVTATSGTIARVTIRHNWINNTSDSGIEAFGAATTMQELLITQNFMDTNGNSNASAHADAIGVITTTAGMVKHG